LRRRLRQHLTRRSALILLGLVALALVIDFLFFTGFYASDDISYIETARTIAEQGMLSPGLGNTRLGVTLPSAFMWWITGGNLTAVVWFYVGYHLALVPIAYVLGRLLLDDRAGLIGAALVAINPLLYVYAGAVLPDNAASCWLGGAMIALVATARYADPGIHWRSWNRRRFLGYFLAGVMIGFCYWCKETALIMTVPAAVLIMTARPGLRSLVWIQNGAIFALGIVSVIALEAIVLRGLTGEWVNRLSFIKDAGNELLATMEREGTTPFARLAYADHHVTTWMPLSMWLLIAGTTAYGFTRGRNVGVMMFFWWPALYLTIGTTSFTRYLPPPIQGRYYGIVILPAAVMTAIATSVLVERWHVRRPRAWTRLALVLALSLVGGYECGRNLPRGGRIYRSNEVQAFIAALEFSRDRYFAYPIVVSPHYSARMFPIILGRNNITLDVAGQKRPNPPYLYIRLVGPGDVPDPDPIAPPPLRVDRLVDVAPPRSRWAVIRDAMQRLVTAKVRPKMSEGLSKKQWAEVLRVRPPATPKVDKPKPASR